jgi:hypothetical protein
MRSQEIGECEKMQSSVMFKFLITYEKIFKYYMKERSEKNLVKWCNSMMGVKDFHWEEFG